MSNRRAESKLGALTRVAREDSESKETGALFCVKKPNEEKGGRVSLGELTRENKEG